MFAEGGESLRRSSGSLGGVVGAFRPGPGFGSGHHEFPAHIILVVQLSHGAFGLIQALHLYEGVAFGTLGAAIVNHLGVFDRADPAEQLEEIGLGGVVRKVSYIDPLGGGGEDLRLRRDRARLAGARSGS